MMKTRTKFALGSQRVLTPQGLQPATLIIDKGRITAVTAFENVPQDCPLEDQGGLVIMPGLIDAHVHINEPGRTDWEGFTTATQAAAAGGVTTIVDMPLNSSPVTTSVEAFAVKKAAAQNHIWVDCGFYAGLVPDKAMKLASLLGAGVLGLKAFLVHSGINDFPNVTEADLRAAMPLLAQSGLPLLIHAELDLPSLKPDLTGLEQLYQAYLASRPPEWEMAAIALMINLCREYGCRVHIVHLSAAEALPMLEAARQEGLSLTVETAPHYLHFAAEDIPDNDTRFKCAPPIRGRHNREKLWKALKRGTIDFIGSDHSPCPPEMKLPESGDLQKAWGGISGLQFSLPVVWTGARQHGCTIEQLSTWFSQNPANFLQLDDRKGIIAPGYVADLVVWNPEATFTVQAEQIYHRHKVTPYIGQTLYGVVAKTLLHGQVVYDQGRIASSPQGEIL